MYGPAPQVPSSSNLGLSSAFGAATAPQKACEPYENRFGSEACGDTRWSRTVQFPTVSTDLIFGMYETAAAPDFAKKSNHFFTAAALTGCPFEKRAFLRSVNSKSSFS